MMSPGCLFKLFKMIIVRRLSLDPITAAVGPYMVLGGVNVHGVRPVDWLPPRRRRPPVLLPPDLGRLLDPVPIVLDKIGREVCWHELGRSVLVHAALAQQFSLGLFRPLDVLYLGLYSQVHLRNAGQHLRGQHLLVLLVGTNSDG